MNKQNRIKSQLQSMDTYLRELGQCLRELGQCLNTLHYLRGRIAELKTAIEQDNNEKE